MQVERILVLRLSSLGDVVLTSTFLKNLRDHFPDAAIDYVVRDDLVDLAAALPGVTRVIAVQRQARGALLAMARQLRHAGYAHAFDLHQSLRSRLLTGGLRGILRPGFAKQSLPRWLLIHAHRDWYDRFGGARALRARMLEPLARMGLETRLHDTEIVVGAAVQRAARARLEQAGIRAADAPIGIVPGARWPSKRWPLERFAALVQGLAATRNEAFVLLGSAAESPLAAAVALAAPQRCADLTGRLGLLETAAVLQRCRCVITNDSGLAHVAEAVGIPVVALFGPTSPRFGYAPYRPGSQLLYRPPPCSPCSKNGSRPCQRPTHECMLHIDVDDVLAGVLPLLPSR
jgi:heptosyltransferase-2